MPYAVRNYGNFCIVLLLYCLNLQNVQTTSPCLNLPRHGCAILKYDKKNSPTIWAKYFVVYSSPLS